MACILLARLLLHLRQLEQGHASLVGLTHLADHAPDAESEQEDFHETEAQHVRTVIFVLFSEPL